RAGLIPVRMRSNSWKFGLALIEFTRLHLRATLRAGRRFLRASSVRPDNPSHRRLWLFHQIALVGYRCTSGSAHAETQMTIGTFLKDRAFDPEDTRLMGAAFDHVCRVLRLPRQNGDARSTAAVLIIELMARGERNPVKLAYAAIRELDKSP